MSGSEAKEMTVLDDPVGKTKEIYEQQQEIVEYLERIAPEKKSIAKHLINSAVAP